MSELCLNFANGLLSFSNFTEKDAALLGSLAMRDERNGVWRAKPSDYAAVVLKLRCAGRGFCDRARAYENIDLTLQSNISPRKHQQKALADWQRADCRGVVALPTGAGKTILALFAMLHIRRSTLIIAPTIDLVEQWRHVLEKNFGISTGMLGGGEHLVAPVTVATYDSAVLNMEFIGNRFGFLIADECHHLPGPVYHMAALQTIAPFRLGLSATPEVEGGRKELMDELIGPIIHRTEIDELDKSILSPYVTKVLRLELSPEEREAYEYNRRIYTSFLRANSINPGSPEAWRRFLNLSSRSERGKAAFAAFLEQRKIARNAQAKFAAIWQIINAHAGEQILIFTADNRTAYEIGRIFRLPVLTCLTGAAERREFLDSFRSHKYRILVTGRVLNEGVDVPEVGVGIVFSGSAGVREHVQRLGRILRPSPGKKQAIMYELLSNWTGEDGVSSRRRNHRAYSGH